MVMSADERESLPTGGFEVLARVGQVLRFFEAGNAAPRPYGDGRKPQAWLLPAASYGDLDGSKVLTPAEFEARLPDLVARIRAGERVGPVAVGRGGRPEAVFVTDRNG